MKYKKRRQKVMWSIPNTWDMLYFEEKYLTCLFNSGNELGFQKALFKWKENGITLR